MLAVREGLKVGVWMTPKEIETPRMNEPPSSKDTKASVTMRLRRGDCAVECIESIAVCSASTSPPTSNLGNGGYND
jgi:hypothetical protein